MSVQFSVSVKGVVVLAGGVLLLLNERDEWELPGGRLEADEQPDACVAREIREETGLAVSVGPVLDSWRYPIRPGPGVLIVTFGCFPLSTAAPVQSAEHRAIDVFSEHAVAGLAMPDGYKRSIAAWYALLSDDRRAWGV